MSVLASGVFERLVSGATLSILDEHLQNWLDGVLFDPTGVELARQRRIVEVATPTVNLGMATPLVGYAYGVDSGDSPAFGLLHTAATEDGSEWSAQYGDDITRRLAGAIAAVLLDTYTGPPVAAIALAVRALEVMGTPPRIGELPALATAALMRLADFIREPPARPKLNFKGVVDAEFKKQALPKADEDITANPAAVRESFANLRVTVRALASGMDGYIDHLSASARRCSEETDLLWWVLAPNADSETTNSPGAAGVATALSISARMTLDPPSRGTPGLIRRGLKAAGVDPDAALALSEFAGAATDEALADVRVSEGNQHWSRPVLSALNRRAVDGTTGSLADGPRLSVEDWCLALIRDLSLERLLP